MLPPFDLDALPGDWWSVVDTKQAQELEDELARELPNGHALMGGSAIAIAVCRQLKDAVFWLPETSEWALEHLTRRVETDPKWPSSFVTPDWQSLAQELT